jgi:CubicO group peptidase (beta-lactamase class C family)
LKQNNLLPAFFIFFLLSFVVWDPVLSQTASRNPVANSTKLSQDSLEKRLAGLDQHMEEIMKDWNVPGCAIGIVKGGKLIYAKGFGYRDVEKKLPVTPHTLFAIASNTKLFVATSIGLLVGEGKLDWDKPVKSLVPEIEFYNQKLNESVTLRDMLSHRTGISAHDGIWYGSAFTGKELFQKLKYLEPKAELREAFLYNNMMYMAAGQIIELKTGKPWEDYVRAKILGPLEMNSTVFSIENMEKSTDYAKPYQSDFSNRIIQPIAFYRQTQGIGPASAVISNVDDLSNWVICQLANGTFKNTEVIPPAVISETMKPESFSDLKPSEDKEIFYRLYGMGRSITTYKGHLMSEHGGAINGFLSQITFFPNDDLGIIVLTNSTGQSLTKFLQYELADRILLLDRTLWNERKLEKASVSAKKQDSDKEKDKPDTPHTEKPTHALSDYTGVYDNPAYGKVEITLANGKLAFHFNLMRSPLTCVASGQFETRDDAQIGHYVLTFPTLTDGSVDQFVIPMDGGEVKFTKSVAK